MHITGTWQYSVTSRVAYRTQQQHERYVAQDSKLTGAGTVFGPCRPLPMPSVAPTSSEVADRVAVIEGTAVQGGHGLSAGDERSEAILWNHVARAWKCLDYFAKHRDTHRSKIVQEDVVMKTTRNGRAFSSRNDVALDYAIVHAKNSLKRLVVHHGWFSIISLAQWFLTGGRAPPGGVNKFLWGRELLRALQHEKFDH